MMFVSKVTLHSCSQHYKIQKEGLAEYIQKGLLKFSPDCIADGDFLLPNEIDS
jgi:hypothetical protein